MLARFVSPTAIHLIAFAIYFGVPTLAEAQPRPQRPLMVTGPLSLPILAALPNRNDANLYSVQKVPLGSVEQSTYKDIAGSKEIDRTQESVAK